MSTSTTSVVSHFPSAQNGFTTTLASTIALGATTVPLNSVAGYTNGQTAVFVIDPTDATKKQTFTGVIDTAGVQVTSVVWTAGTNVAHSGGATVVDYATATHISMMTKGILVDHTQKGRHKTLYDDSANEWIEQGSTASAVNQVKISNAATATDPVLEASGDDSNIGLTLKPKGTSGITFQKRLDGWVTGLTAPNTVTYNGNRSYSLVFNALDLTGFISPGMRLRTTRTVTAPTQCTSLNGTTQYYSKSSPAGMTFTDDFVVSAWIKLTSYGAGDTIIASRYNGTSGWRFLIQNTGQVYMAGLNAGAANISRISSAQSIPLNRWVHVTAQLDMSAFTATTATSYIMIDGVDVPATVARAGTNPTALIQAGNLEIGSENGGTNFFPGKIAQVAIYNAKVTQATITASLTQTLSGTETSEISAYSFNNSINDLNANANNLTANGSAVATNADSPFAGGANASTAYTAGTTDFGEVFGISFSTNTTVVVQVPEGYTIPTSGGISALAYSVHSSPLGWFLPGGVKELAFVQVMVNQTEATGSYVDLSGLTSAVYIPAGRQVRVSANTPEASNAGIGGGADMNVMDSTATLQLTSSQCTTSAANQKFNLNPNTLYTPPASGSRTFKSQIKQTIGSTASTNGSTTTPLWLRVELV